MGVSDRLRERAMAVQERLKLKGLILEPDRIMRIAFKRAIAVIEAVLAQVQEAARVKLRVEATLAQIQQVLAAVQIEVESECQTGLKIEQARAEVEAALAQAKQTTGTEPEGTEPPPTALGEEGAERRVTFVVRLTVDERNQPRRTEVEHVQSGGKETIPGLDAQRLIAFMKVCINLPNPSETDDSP